MELRRMTGEVSCLDPYEWIETPWSIAGSYGQVQLSDRHVVCVDYGAKRNILPSLGVARRAFRHSWPTGGRRCRNSRGAAWAHNRTRPSRPIRVGRRARPTFPKGSGSSCSRSRTDVISTAAMHTPLPRWVIRVEGNRGRPSMHFRYSPKS